MESLKNMKVDKNKMLDKHLDKQEENKLYNLEKKE
jgi:hypothetical protein